MKAVRLFAGVFFKASGIAHGRAGGKLPCHANARRSRLSRGKLERAVLSSMGVRHPNRPLKVFFASTCSKPLIGHRPPPAYRDIGQSAGPHRVKGGVPRGNVLGGRVADVCEANAKLWKQTSGGIRMPGKGRPFQKGHKLAKGSNGEIHCSGMEEATGAPSSLGQS